MNWLKLPFSLSILATLAVSAGLFLLRRRWPGLLAAWLSYLLVLAPVSGIIRNNPSVIAADRYSYMPMLCLVMLAAACFCQLWRMSSRSRPVAASGSSRWPRSAPGSDAHDAEPVPDLAEHGNPLDPCIYPLERLADLPQYNLGIALQNKGSYKAAVAHYTERCGSIPAKPYAHYNLGSPPLYPTEV